jgi:sulfoxide reductase heme-binding subunit YedZ
MSDIEPITKENNPRRLIAVIAGGILLLAALVLGAAGYLIFKNPVISHATTNLFTWLFATNTTHTTWYITRAAGWVAYFLLWFSMVWGLAIPTKYFERYLSPTFVVDFHEYISLLAIGFVILHVSVLMIDQYLPFTLAQILVPFMAPYRPLWVGLGVIGAYLSMLVTVTFYLRKRIGQKRFKAIHTLSMAGYLGVILHAFFAGSDSSLPAVQLIYLGTFLVVVFLTAYWLINARINRQEKEARAIAAASRQGHAAGHPVHPAGHQAHPTQQHSHPVRR